MGRRALTLHCASLIAGGSPALLWTAVAALVALFAMLVKRYSSIKRREKHDEHEQLEVTRLISHRGARQTFQAAADFE